MTELLHFHTLDDLEALSLADLQALWELVPSERQRSYKQAYERELHNADALGSDQREQQVADELLRRYRESALVPVGTRWARTPQRVRAAAQADDGLAAVAQALPTHKTPSRTLIALGTAVLLIFVGLLVLRSTGDADSEATPVADAADATPTAGFSATATPLALEAQDDIIAGGDDARAVAYPVSLQIALPTGDPPRVWVIQRRAVRASEWRYDPNPDIASFINGLVVRPAIGIPHSPENAAYFDQLGPGAVFTVAMNTGAQLRFEFAARSAVRRSATEHLRQVSPGLALLLIGERDPDGLPTATRTLISAHYPPAQELGRDGALTLPRLQALTATPTPQRPPERFAGVDVQLIAATTQPGRLTTHLRLYNGGQHPLYLTQDDIWLALGYAPDPPGPRQPATALHPITLLPEQAVDLTLVWARGQEPHAALQVGAHRFAIAFE